MNQKNRAQFKIEIEEKRETKSNLENEIRKFKKAYKWTQTKEDIKHIDKQIYSLQEKICGLEEEIWEIEKLPEYKNFKIKA